MTDHERWTAQAEKMEEQFCRILHLETVTPETKQQFYNYVKGMFIADCSDDYSRTLREQHELKEALLAHLVNIGYENTLIKGIFKWN